jgi:hypothetical protein
MHPILANDTRKTALIHTIPFREEKPISAEDRIRPVLPSVHSQNFPAILSEMDFVTSRLRHPL